MNQVVTEGVQKTADDTEIKKDSQGLSASKLKTNNGLGTIDDYPWFKRMFGKDR